MQKVWIALAALALLIGAWFFIPEWMKTGVSPTFKASNNSLDFSNWKEFTPQSGLFKVLLPSSPQYAKDLVTIPDSEKKRRYDMYASEKIDGKLFLISVITYPPEVDTSMAADILHQTVEELMKSSPENKITKLKDKQFQEIPALEFNLNNGKFMVEGTVFSVGKRIYVLSYVTPVNEFSAEEFQHFIDSFQILQKE